MTAHELLDSVLESLFGIDGPPRVHGEVQLHGQPGLAGAHPLHGEHEQGARPACHRLEQRAAQRGGREPPGEEPGLAEGAHVLRAAGEQLARLVRVRVRVRVRVGVRARVRV